MELVLMPFPLYAMAVHKSADTILTCHIIGNSWDFLEAKRHSTRWDQVGAGLGHG
jgi:hypothetical protein